MYALVATTFPFQGATIMTKGYQTILMEQLSYHTILWFIFLGKIPSPSGQLYTSVILMITCGLQFHIVSELHTASMFMM